MSAEILREWGVSKPTLKEKYEGKIKISKGMSVGSNQQTIHGGNQYFLEPHIVLVGVALFCCMTGIMRVQTQRYISNKFDQLALN